MRASLRTATVKRRAASATDSRAAPAVRGSVCAAAACRESTERHGRRRAQWKQTTTTTTTTGVSQDQFKSQKQKCQIYLISQATSRN